MRKIDWRRGWRSGLETTWELTKVILPVTLVVSVLKYTPVIEWLVEGLTPLMGWFGLPGEAAVPLALGNLLNLYAAIGAILTMDLTVKQVLILAVMLSFSHNLLVETALCRRVGLNPFLVASVRIGLALISALLIHILWSGGGERASFGWVGAAEDVPEGWGEIILLALKTALTGALQLALVVIPLMIGIQVLKDIQVLDRFAGWMKPLMRPLGLDPRGAVTMAGGLLFGLAMGAGVIIQQAREQQFSRREMTLIILFLAACHAVVEDTLLFVPLGVNIFALLLIRLGAAIFLTVTVAWLWPKDRGASVSVRGDHA
ncbi:hypothetical protein CLV97_10658 [Planifilum fimeticola]|uniref:Nucleoside transporter/FeoB GTPase Gate domain-containing protein n=1 Tax=Planifilum fimeticola TaxID=201975 RepID=A0A2T0LGN6_9BACL|nr:nucleoside recognition domain-containing protein [Planifilum fimeticola]PRX41448.1 hypothetical protein CLV97_10658 [Planifilum fimeticola]